MSMPRTRFVVAVVLSLLMVLSAGCAGFGTDGPIDPAKEFDGTADDRENGSSANDTEAIDESLEESDGDDEDSNEYDSTDPPESSSEDGSDELPATDGSDDGGSVDDADGTDDTEEGDDAGSGTNSGQEDTSSSDDGNGDAANGGDDGDADAPSEDGEGEDAPTENGSDADEESPESDDADDGESGEEEPIYTLTVEADAPVTLERTWEDASTTREPTDGTVEFSVIEGSYTLSADGYYDVTEEVAIRVDSDTRVTMQSEDGADVKVTVVDAETGEGIEGAEISGICDWYYSSGDVYVTGETDADGVANAHAELSPTDCDATVSAGGYASENVDLAVPDGDGLTVALEPEESGRPRPTP